MKKAILVLPALLLLARFFLFTGCANIMAPTGGPKDTIPPVLLSVNPPDSTLHFHTDRIVFNFDEYLELKDIRDNLIVSPVPKTEPIVEYKLKTITVRLKDSLRPNTTYSFNFGKAIRDNNEGNILNNFTYVFSTGSFLDSLELRGKVMLAETGKTDSTLIVMLHTNLEDSAVAKDRPHYIARLDSAGNYHFQNLASGTYRIYALKDEGGSKKYTAGNQLFAFLDSPILIGQNNAPIVLYAYMDTTGSKPIKKPAPATAQKAKTQDKEKRLIVQTNLTSGRLELDSNLEFLFSTPLKVFDSAQVRFTDEKFVDIKGYHFIRDSSGKKVTLVYNWPLDTKYHVIASKEFAEDTLGRKLLKTDSISFETKKASDYGRLTLRFPNLDLSRNPVLEFVQKDAIILKAILTRKGYDNKLFPPGEYELRVLYDDNKNGVWDPGKFFDVHRQPEKVQLVKMPKGKPLTVKADWDNENEITL